MQDRCAWTESEWVHNRALSLCLRLMLAPCPCDLDRIDDGCISKPTGLEFKSDFSAVVSNTTAAVFVGNRAISDTDNQNCTSYQFMIQKRTERAAYFSM